MSLVKSSLWIKEYIIVDLVNFFTAINYYLLMVDISEFAIKGFGSPSNQAGFVYTVRLLHVCSQENISCKMDDIRLLSWDGIVL